MNAADSPHLSLALPYAFVNERLGAKVKDLPPVPVKAPLPGMEKLSLVPRALELRPARDDRAGLRLVLAVRDADETLADLDVEVEVKPVIDLEKRTVVLAMRPDDLRNVVPELGAKSKKALGDALYDRLPAAGRALMGRDRARDAAADLVKEVVRHGWPAVRDHLLADAGEVTRFSVSLGELPLQRVALRHDAKASALRLDAWTPLAGAAGLKAQTSSASRKPRLRVAGPAFASLGNWAMEKDKLPSRYDAKGKPKPDGPYRPALRWQPESERPLWVHVFALEGECVHAQLSAVPSATVVNGRKGAPQLRVQVDDGTLEKVDGPFLMEIGAFLYGIWMDAIQVTKNLTTDTRIELPGGHWKLAVAGASVTTDEIILDLDFDPLDAKP